jgi:phenylalanyl-tRNA synthetase beta chain
MKVSLEWLSDFVTFKESNPEEIAAALTVATGEVDEIIQPGLLLAHMCVGKVIKTEKHPNADRLAVCTVRTDRGMKQVVCGGTNLREGMRVAFAHVGARVKWHGSEMQMLQKVTLRGVESEGMICAAEELGLESRFPPQPEHGERPIVDLGSGDESVGQPLAEYLGLTDTVFHIDNHAITHRADLFSHVGIARESVALGIAKWKKGQPSTFNIQHSTFPKSPLPFSLANEAGKFVPRYSGVMLTFEHMGSTPERMKKRLEAVGVRSINPPIDITNYVMLELGMPMHAFDAADLRGDVRIRRAKKGEVIRTLDGVTRDLPEGAIVMSDDEGIFDLLGIMGGHRSSIKEATKNIYLHAAVADPVTIRSTIIALSHRTDAATIYEKGIPHVSVGRGMARALELFKEIVPGARVASNLVSWGDDGKAKPIALSLERVRSMLGVALPEKKIAAILESLEFAVKKGKSKGTLAVTPPLHRLGDIRGPHDLVEEIGRVAGYNEIEPAMPVAPMHLPARDDRLHRMRDTLKEEGYFEIVPLSLLSPSLLQKSRLDPGTAVRIANPIGEELSLLQTSTLPSLLEHAGRTVGQTERVLKTFHWGHVFRRAAPEHSELSLLVAARGRTGLTDDPFLLLKQHLERMLAAVGFKMEVTPVVQTPSYAHPHRFATVSVLGSVVGEMFEVHPAVRAAFDLPSRAAASTINLSTLLSMEGATTTAAALPAFPAVTYDETIALSPEENVGDIIASLAEAHELLESVQVADLYEGPALGRDRYNLTLRFVYRASDRTLTEEETQKVHEEILARLKAKV